MNLVLKGAWAGDVRIKCAANKEWEDAYLVLQERRLAWWAREQDADDGRAAVGQLLLFGHAGVTQVLFLVICRKSRKWRNEATVWRKGNVVYPLVVIPQ